MPFRLETLVDLVVFLVKADPDVLIHPVFGSAVEDRQIENELEKLICVLLQEVVGCEYKPDRTV